MQTLKSTPPMLFCTIRVTQNDIIMARNNGYEDPCTCAVSREFGTEWECSENHRTLLETEAPFRSLTLPSDARQQLKTYQRKQQMTPFAFVAEVRVQA